jgi:formate dehydrogenase subunit delta
MRAKLARMSGQIADFFRNLPTEDAVRETARHINLYWSGSMRRDFSRLFTPQSPELHRLVQIAWPEIKIPAK